MQNVLITGSNGFIGKNLNMALKERNFSVLTFTREDDINVLTEKVIAADIIYHLAGINRPLTDDEFVCGNTNLTETLVKIIVERNPNVPLIYASSKQAEKDNAYGKSKLNAEKIIQNAVEKSNINASIYRLNGVFGKWCRPNYNSVVATFCYNVINDIPLIIDDPLFNLEIIYIDDVIDAFVGHLHNKKSNDIFYDIPIKYKISIQKLADKIIGFKSSRNNLTIDSVGKGITRALYATYLSYLPPEKFSYTVPIYEDLRGSFAELLKTSAYGQFSFFTAKPGIIRGGHYHHTKNEKFIVVSGRALFRFEHIITHEVIEFEKNSSNIEIVETIPGWAHNIKNIGSNELIVMLWANEVFDRNKPDTIAWDILYEK
ncbi:NAD-dependent epimerase/dehydratase family protein [Candidatus Arsenophonus triatominarum]|uniref:polysaccharide biosynthesis C-terminal domain-containing protein n=1 Tax=Candidatus Arsenophonus triatominarum TaxID=57911 RepID=UPI0007C53788|nr:NAD-dependent epimerase/dehydratase family protein [Candidatus Arsenophonus triatominarum]